MSDHLNHHLIHHFTISFLCQCIKSLEHNHINWPFNINYVKASDKLTGERSANMLTSNMIAKKQDGKWNTFQLKLGTECSPTIPSESFHILSNEAMRKVIKDDISMYLNKSYLHHSWLAGSIVVFKTISWVEGWDSTP